MPDVIVIGAGQAGLGTSYHLRQRGVEHVVLERGRIGETWRSQRWDSFRLNTTNAVSRLPGVADASDPSDGFGTGEAFIRQLETYATEFDLPVRERVAVTSVEPGPRGEGFLVRSRSDGQELEPMGSRAVVVASGVQRVPKMPALARALPRAVMSVHTADYRSPAALPDGGVLVVGCGQSGVQVVEDLLDAGRTVYFCTSAVGRMPRRYRGRDIIDRLLEIGFMDIRPEELPDPALRFARQPMISGIGRRGHTVSLQDLARQGVVLLGRPRDIRGDRLELEDTLGANIAFSDERSAFFKRVVDEGLQRIGDELEPVEDDPADEPHPNPTAVHSPEALDLAKAGVRTVIWATGFGGEFEWLHGPALGPDGVPVHRDGVSEVPGLYFMGFPWLSRRKSGIIPGVDDDAAFITAHAAKWLGTAAR